MQTFVPRMYIVADIINLLKLFFFFPEGWQGSFIKRRHNIPLHESSTRGLNHQQRKKKCKKRIKQHNYTTAMLQ